MEIACDESGWEGSNLATANPDVIAYASVGLDTGAASAIIGGLREQAGQPLYEYKASHLMRATGRADLAEFLGVRGPVHDRAWVHLTHKSCFMIGRVLDLFLGGSAEALSLGLRPDDRLAGHATRLCRTGRQTFGRDAWMAFLAAANNVLRANRRPRVKEPVDAFFDQVEVLGAGGADEVLGALSIDRQQAYAARARLLDDHVLHPVLEPLIPAFVRTVLHWTDATHPVAIVHDEQSAMTRRRIERIEQILASPPLAVIRPPGTGRFIEFRQVDSRTDPRIQVADLLAGVARRIATEALFGRGDAELTALLRPYVDPASRWCGHL